MRLLELREEKNLSQSDIANAINTSRTNIGRWEKGTNEPSSSALIALADYFEVSIDYLLGREDDFGNVHVNASAPPLPADGKELLEIFLSLPREYRVQVLEYARYFGERSAQAQKSKA